MKIVVAFICSFFCSFSFCQALDKERMTKINTEEKTIQSLELQVDHKILKEINKQTIAGKSDQYKEKEALDLSNNNEKIKSRDQHRNWLDDQRKKDAEANKNTILNINNCAIKGVKKNPGCP